MSRGYGGSSYGGSSPYYPTYHYMGSYSSSGTRDSRSSTPGRSSSIAMVNSVVMRGSSASDVDRGKREAGRNAISGYPSLGHTTAPVAYKYFSRSDFYNPTVIFNRSMSREDSGSLTKARQEELRTIKTEDIDVELSSKDTNRDHAIPGAIKRDTAVVAGGKQVIRLVTTKQKSNPYNLVGRNKNATTSNGQSVELTMGQRLAMKHFIPVQQPLNNQSGSVNCTKSGESGPESDWTWETCSSSDEEAVTFVKNADKSWSKEAGGGDCGGDTASTCSGRTISSSVLSVKEAAVKPKEVKKDSPAAKSSTSRPGERGGGVSSYQSILQKYSKYNLPSASSPKLNRNSSDGQSCSPQLHRKVTEEKKDTSFDWLRAPVKQTAYTRPTTAAAASVAPSETQKSSSSSASTPPLIPKRYTGAGSKTIKFSSNALVLVSDPRRAFVLTWRPSKSLNFTWRKGQPPRSDCVVKLSTGTATAKKDNSKSLASAQSGTNYNSSRATNKLLSCKETPDTTSSPSGPKGQNSDSPRNQPDKSIERIEVGVKVPAVTPSVHESDIKSELSELSSEISLSTAVVNEVKKASTPETLTVKKVSLPPLNYATDSRLSSFSEEKSDRLKVSQVPSTQTIRPVLESDLMVRAVPTPSPDARHAPPPAALPSVPQTPAIPPLSPDPVAIRHNNSLADFAFSPVARSAYETSSSEPSSPSQSENYYPSDSDSTDPDSVPAALDKSSASESEEASDEGAGGHEEAGCPVGSLEVPLTVVEMQEALRTSELGGCASDGEAVVLKPPSSAGLKETSDLPVTELEKCNLSCDIKTIVVSDSKNSTSLSDESSGDIVNENMTRNDNTASNDIMIVREDESKVGSECNLPKVEIASDIQMLKNNLTLDLTPGTRNSANTSNSYDHEENGRKLHDAKKQKSQSQCLVQPKDHHFIPTGLQGNASLKHENHLQMVKDTTNVGSGKSGSDDEKSQSRTSRSGSCSSTASLSIFESTTIAAQLDRIPSPMRKMFELRANHVLNPAGECGKKDPPLSPEGEVPKYWNNKPKTDPNAPSPFINAFHEMSAMKSEQKKHQAKIKEEQMALLSTSEGEPEEAWYKDESEEMQAQLQHRLEQCERRPSDINNKPDGEKKSPEENMAIIQLYGGIQFPDSMELDVTPSTLLRKINEFEEESDEDLQQLESEDYLRVQSQNLANFNDLQPVTIRPKFRKYGVDDFRYLRVLGKGSFGKVILSELKADDSKDSANYYAIKCLRKDLVLDDDDVECTLIERKVLALGSKHPFLCHLFCTFQTHSHLFFVMEYLNGGDLMFHIQQAGRFDEERARFYSAEILTALRFMHKKGVVYRDLKLDNLLLDHEGHIRIADFGMCKLQAYLDRTTDTFCGTPDYMAPEIIKGLKYTFCVDWWSFGVLLYEMLIGQSPFNGCDEDELFWSICNEQPYYPKFITREAIQILMKLLEKDPSKRLGTKSCSAGAVQDQPFFRQIDFVKVEQKKIKPPFKPKLKHPLDVSYFDSAFTKEDPLLTPLDPDFLNNVNQMQFKGFSLTNRNYTLPPSD